jgi:hypothetical protein
MPIYLDDEVVTLAGEDLGAVLTAAREFVSPFGRVIVEVEMDGQALIGEELEHKRTQLIGESTLRLHSLSARELAASAIVNVRTELADARTAQTEAAELFQQDQMGSAMARLGVAMQVWDHAPQALMNAVLIVGMDADKIELDGKPMGELTQELLEKLRALRDAIWAKDSVALGDALAYEWPAMTDRWDALARQLIQRVTSGNPKPAADER